MDLQESALDKEATRFAILYGDSNLDIVRTSWEVCAHYIKQYIKTNPAETKEEILILLDTLLGISSLT